MFVGLNVLFHSNVCPCILEHLQPRAGFGSELVVWLVGHLHGAEQTLWVRHHDGGAAVGCGESCRAGGGAVRVGWILLSWFAVEVDVAGADLITCEAFLEVACGREVGAAFAVGDGDREEAACHPLEEDAWAFHDFDVCVARFELLGAVTDELWPVLCAWDDVLQLGDHLATVADA